MSGFVFSVSLCHSLFKYFFLIFIEHKKFMNISFHLNDKRNFASRHYSLELTVFEAGGPANLSLLRLFLKLTYELRCELIVKPLCLFGHWVPLSRHLIVVRRIALPALPVSHR